MFKGQEGGLGPKVTQVEGGLGTEVARARNEGRPGPEVVQWTIKIRGLRKSNAPAARGSEVG